MPRKLAAALRTAKRETVSSRSLESAGVSGLPSTANSLSTATIAHALEVRESGGRSARELLLAHLRAPQLLLVLDNFEHLLGATALLAELLEGCPRLAVLATSRAALRLRAEQRLRVAPLPAPAHELQSIDAIAASPAVCLFVERAQAVAPEFVLDAASAPGVAAICRRLDGMPLAIELAAARVGLLRPEALLQRLGHRLQLLTSGPADLPERQQTLRATLAWSHDLLGRPEQMLFRRLAVFVGGWTLEAAESVCAGADLPPQEVLERLGVLVDNSLVHPLDRAASEPRFAMLETVREFAQELLIASGEAEAVRARQLGYYLQLAEAAMPELQGAAQVRWLDRLEAEHDNFRLVLAWPAPPPSMAPNCGWPRPYATSGISAAITAKGAIGCWLRWHCQWLMRARSSAPGRSTRWRSWIRCRAS
jgi:predicted ATPase